MTAQELIQASMRKLGVIASGETPTTNELNDGLSALQSMLRRWASAKLLVFASTKETFTLTSGTSIYSWGSGGDINTTRPYLITGASIDDSSGVTHPVDIISEGKYRSISVKSTTDRPYALFFNPVYPLASLYLYPVPNAAETLNLDSVKPFTETSSIDVLSSTISFPPNYEEALIYNLAVRIASEFGKVITAEVATIASNSYDDLVVLNAANQIENIDIIIPVVNAGRVRYSINSDSYR